MQGKEEFEEMLMTGSYHTRSATKIGKRRRKTVNDEVGHMQVTKLTEHEDGGATIEFEMDDTTAALAKELGIKLLIYCGATGTDLDYVFKSILGETDE